jgi:DNA-3-methyladenine glycosylase I
MVIINSVNRCSWVTKDQIYIDYHDKEWGVPIYEDHKIFEFLILEGAQAGLSWFTILKKRENYRRAYDYFNPELIANYDEEKKNELLINEGIVRNKLKIESSVINAKCFIEVQKDYGTFKGYIWNFIDNKPMQQNFNSVRELPTKNDVSDKISKDLKKRGFKFVGSTIIYAFMQATGMINDHVSSCFRHKELS